MAHIVVITHEHDRLLERKIFRRTTSSYMIYAVLEELSRRGHSWEIAQGPASKAKGDIAILHVDTTQVGHAYVEFARGFRFCLNLGATDISKRRVSVAEVKPGDGWAGPVIVKTVLNCGGLPEGRINQRATRRGLPLPFPNARIMKDYQVFDHSSQVPDDVFSDPSILVERFLPEIEPDGFGLRYWLFCCDYDFCGRFISRERLVKGAGVFRSEPCPIPDDLRQRREELGFDFGKFDFAVHDGKTYLMDANKTPGRVPKSAGEVASTAQMAEAFDRKIRMVLA